MNVEPRAWLGVVQGAKADGFDYFDWLGCVDEIGRADTFRVVLVLRDLRRPGLEPLVIQTQVPREDPRLESLGGVFPGAGWHEREAAELFGIDFLGGNPARLLLANDFVGHPLRKDDVLAARAGIPWPGAKEPGEPGSAPSRRQIAAPGVPDPSVWGDRDGTVGHADPAAVAESAGGIGSRRRRP